MAWNLRARAAKMVKMISALKWQSAGRAKAKIYQPPDINGAIYGCIDFFDFSIFSLTHGAWGEGTITPKAHRRLRRTDERSGRNRIRPNQKPNAASELSSEPSLHRRFIDR